MKLKLPLQARGLLLAAFAGILLCLGTLFGIHQQPRLYASGPPVPGPIEAGGPTMLGYGQWPATALTNGPPSNTFPLDGAGGTAAFVYLDDAGFGHSIPVSAANVGQTMVVTEAGTLGLGTAGGGSTLARLMPIEAGVMQFYWPLDNDGAAPPYQPNFGVTAGDGSTYAMAGISSPCGTDKTGLFFGAMRCINQSGTGSGLYTAVVPGFSVPITTQATMSAWVWPISFTSGAQYVSWAYRNSGWSSPYVAMSISQTTTGGCWTCSMAVAGSLLQATVQTCVSTWPGQQYLNQWQLLACVWNAPTLSIYYNGEFIYSATADGGSTSTVMDMGDGGPIMLMTTTFTSGGGSDGFIDDVRIESVARNQSYLRQQYQMGVSGSQN